MNKIQLPIKTQRLALSAYKNDFFEDFYQLKQLPETHRYNYTPVLSKKEALKYVKNFVYYDYNHPKKRFELAVILKNKEKYIGYIGFKSRDFKKAPSAEIYFTLHSDYFNRGLGTEAVKAMMDFGFNILGFHRIWAGATCENTASWKIMEKLGMRRECHWLEDRPKPGPWIKGKGYKKTNQWENGYGYAILKKEYMIKTF